MLHSYSYCHEENALAPKWKTLMELRRQGTLPQLALGLHILKQDETNDYDSQTRAPCLLLRTVLDCTARLWPGIFSFCCDHARTSSSSVLSRQDHILLSRKTIWNRRNEFHHPLDVIHPTITLNPSRFTRGFVDRIAKEQLPQCTCKDICALWWRWHSTHAYPTGQYAWHLFDTAWHGHFKTF